MLLGAVAASRILTSSQLYDPYWDNVVSLLTLDQTVGDTTFRDEKNIVWSRAGQVVISDAQAPRGYSTSAVYDGNNDRLTTANFGLSGQLFTMEAWAYWDGTNNSLNRHQHLFGISGTAGNIETGVAFLPSDRSVFCNRIGGSSGPTLFSAPNIIEPNKWQFWRYDWDGTTARVFIDAVEVLSFEVADGWWSPWLFSLGASISSYNTSYRSDWKGHIGAFRLTKGVVRPDTSVPTQAFPIQGQPV